MNKQVLILLSLTALFVYGCSENKASENKNAAPAPAVTHYTLANAKHEQVEQIMKLPAQLAAYQEVSIFPKVNGAGST
jgi:membrane fusion protein (multidrug efflux system)